MVRVRVRVKVRVRVAADLHLQTVHIPSIVLLIYSTLFAVPYNSHIKNQLKTIK